MMCITPLILYPFSFLLSMHLARGLSRVLIILISYKRLEIERPKIVAPSTPSLWRSKTEGTQGLLSS
jgi:hypothetical protein